MHISNRENLESKRALLRVVRITKNKLWKHERLTLFSGDCPAA